MLRILSLMAGNIAKGPSTVPFPGQVPTPEAFRGLVRIDVSRCLTCGMCSYVCVSGAITGREKADHYQWNYDPGRCTFCARCASRCPGQALAMGEQPAPSYGEHGALASKVQVPLPLCPDCGKPTTNAPEEWLQGAFANVDDRTRDLAHLCIRCRRKRVQRGLFPSAGDAL